MEQETRNMEQETRRRRQGVKTLLVSCCLLLVATSVFATVISFDSKTTQAQVDKNFEVTLFVNTEQENINAFEGKIIFPNDLLDLKEIRDGNTIVNFWVERPHKEQGTGDKKQGEIAFSGITPGGYEGEKGLLFSAVFRALREGDGVLEVKDVKALLNDGKGTPARLSLSPFKFIVSKEDPLVPGLLIPAPEDIEPPESFKPEIARDSTIFDGKWFLVFATQDKGLGIGRYEIKETRSRISGLFSKWISSESPYALRDQKLRSYIFVKAVDKAGNVRIEKILPRNPLKWYERWEIWIIIVLGLVIAYAVYKATRSKRQGARK